PPIGDPRRGPYLSWLVYNDAVIDPVLAAKFGGWVYEKPGVSFGVFEDMVGHLEATLSRTPYLTGDTFSAADMLVGGAINCAVRITKAIPESPALIGFIERTVGRPSFASYLAADRALQGA
ncbi:MAG TPA: glutathione S-transferase family protein, partial [Caulobacteraceae bacterium]|nr:glutathione S-transferase family protein [Caulobacteraceae bacterium]